MCDCCNKIIVRNEIPVVGPTGPQGPIGLTGPQGIQGIPGTPGVSPSPLTSFLDIDRNTISTMVYLEFTIPILDAGDFVIQLEYYGQNATGFTSLTTSVILNTGAGNTLDVSNNNFQHVIQPVLGPLEVVIDTYTHTARVRGLSPGQFAGFRFSALGSPFTIENGSITLTKLTT